MTGSFLDGDPGFRDRHSDEREDVFPDDPPTPFEYEDTDRLPRGPVPVTLDDFLVSDRSVDIALANQRAIDNALAYVEQPSDREVVEHRGAA